MGFLDKTSLRSLLSEMTGDIFIGGEETERREVSDIGDALPLLLCGLLDNFSSSFGLDNRAFFFFFDFLVFFFELRDFFRSLLRDRDRLRLADRDFFNLFFL